MKKPYPYYWQERLAHLLTYLAYNPHLEHRSERENSVNPRIFLSHEQSILLDFNFKMMNFEM